MSALLVYLFVALAFAGLIVIFEIPRDRVPMILMVGAFIFVMAHIPDRLYVWSDYVWRRFVIAIRRLMRLIWRRRK